MKKSDLQNFDIVEIRNGLLFLVNADSGVLYGDSGWVSLDNYKDDLTDVGDCGCVSGFDIVRVKRPKQTYGLCSWADHPIVWERREAKE